jgi:hypothetical protein
MYRRPGREPGDWLAVDEARELRPHSLRRAVGCDAVPVPAPRLVAFRPMLPQKQHVNGVKKRKGTRLISGARFADAGR